MYLLRLIWLFAAPWTLACQAPLSMGFFRQEYSSGLPSPSPGDLPNPGIKLASLASPTWEGRFFYCWATWETIYINRYIRYSQRQALVLSLLLNIYVIFISILLNLSVYLPTYSLSIYEKPFSPRLALTLWWNAQLLFYFLSFLAVVFFGTFWIAVASSFPKN